MEAPIFKIDSIQKSISAMYFLKASFLEKTIYTGFQMAINAPVDIDILIDGIAF